MGLVTEPGSSGHQVFSTSTGRNDDLVVVAVNLDGREKGGERTSSKYARDLETALSSEVKCSPANWPVGTEPGAGRPFRPHSSLSPTPGSLLKLLVAPRVPGLCQGRTRVWRVTGPGPGPNGLH